MLAISILVIDVFDSLPVGIAGAGAIGFGIPPKERISRCVEAIVRKILIFVILDVLLYASFGA